MKGDGWIEVGFVGELEGVLVYVDVEVGVEFVVDLDGFGGVDVLVVYELVGFVGVDGKYG